MNTPLAGVRVLDLSRLLPGAFCTHILRELGATITKIEPPGGDPLRRLAPIAADGNSVFHHLLNQGKENLDAWWISISTFVVLAVTLMLLILIGDALRDALDPRKVLEGDAQ